MNLESDYNDFVNRPRPTRVVGEPGPGKAPVIFRAMTACDCGCGRRARFEFSTGLRGGSVIIIDDPATIRALIAEMCRGYERLWGGTYD